jgi:ATP-dependent Clp protease ATP-binding subunit ClpC
MTSNLGARVIQKRASLGFQASADASRASLEEQVMQQVRQTFQPEFINRLDEIIIFDELTNDDLLKILDLQIGRLNTVVAARGLKLVLTDRAQKWLIDKTCSDRKYGARPLKRALQKHLEDELSEALIQGHIADDSTVEVDTAGGGLAFREIRAREPEKELSQKA